MPHLRLIMQSISACFKRVRLRQIERNTTLWWCSWTHRCRGHVRSGTYNVAHLVEEGIVAVMAHSCKLILSLLHLRSYLCCLLVKVFLDSLLTRGAPTRLSPKSPQRLVKALEVLGTQHLLTKCLEAFNELPGNIAQTYACMHFEERTLQHALKYALLLPAAVPESFCGLAPSSAAPPPSA